MAESGGQEKTETPSEKKREDARKEGQVAQSKELPSAVLLGSFSLYFYMTGDYSMRQMEALFHHSLSHLSRADFTPLTLSRFLIDTLLLVTPLMLGIFGIALVVGVSVSIIQVGVVFVPFKFKPERLDPIQGFQRIFSANGVAELFKSLFKMGVIGYVTYISYRQEIMPLMALSEKDPQAIFDFNFSLIGTLFFRVALALAVLSAFDYLFQRWNLEQQLMMTKQEMKEELKQSEGDPHLKARVRQVMRQMSQARMMENVPKADVVVTNPTHFAVALMYDREVMDAPRLVAKGADFVAHRIRDVAAENKVPVVENPPIAREIYNTLDVGDEIPEQLFRAVAEILAYVYRLKGKKL